MDEDMEERLNHSFSSGGPEELELAINLYGHRLLRYCHNILCDYYEAQDAVQITFMKAYQKRKRFQAGTSLSSWLYRIAYRTCVDLLRRKKRFPALASLAEEREDQVAYETNQDIKEALLKLSIKERALLYGRIMEGRSYGELARIHKASEATIRKRYERTKKKFTAILKNENSYYARLEGAK